MNTAEVGSTAEEAPSEEAYSPPPQPVRFLLVGTMFCSFSLTDLLPIDRPFLKLLGKEFVFVGFVLV